jgi:hypothetical protein
MILLRVSERTELLTALSQTEIVEASAGLSGSGSLATHQLRMRTNENRER